MAVTKILARRGGLSQAIAYVLNGDKTEEQILTAAQGCLTSTACHDMAAVKQRWNKTDGVQLYHVIQSFRPGELSPELALEIAREFAREHLPGYQAIIGVHTDREHIHAHIVFNSVNQFTGEKYHSNAQSYYQQIRGISDRLCREHGLSVIVQGEPARSVSYIEWLRQSKGQPTFRSMLEADLRAAIQDANDLGHFFLLMEHMGYEIHHGDRLGFACGGRSDSSIPAGAARCSRRMVSVLLFKEILRKLKQAAVPPCSHGLSIGHTWRIRNTPVSLPSMCIISICWVRSGSGSTRPA